MEGSGSLFVVAVTRWAGPVADQLAGLAPLLGGTAYDLRLRLMGPLPVVVQRVGDESAARTLLAGLRKRGHGAVACDLGKAKSSDQMLSPREFSLKKEALVVPGVPDGRVSWDGIVALFPATRMIADSSISTGTRRKLSLGRAVMTAGLKPTRKKTTVQRGEEQIREQILYLYRKKARPVLLGELRLRFANLEEFMGRSTTENFNTLVAILRQRAPHAIFDDRLANQIRKASSLDVSGTGKNQTITSSNASDLDLAAHLLLLAYLSNQV